MAQPDSSTSTPALPAGAHDLLGRGLRFVTVATINADGSPHQAVAWFRFVDDAIVLNSREGRIWPANLGRDPRVSLTIEDGYRWLSIQGRVHQIEDRATSQADIAEMARRYHADEPQRAEAMIRDRFERQVRVSFRLPLATAKLHYHED